MKNKDSKEKNNEKKEKKDEAKGKTFEHVAHKHIKKRKQKLNIWLIISIVFISLFAIQLLWAPFPSPIIKGNFIKPYEDASKETVSLDLYVMSQCPYGISAEAELDKVLTQMGDYVDYNIDFIGMVQSDGSFSSLHGEKEIQGDMIQLCVKEHYPEKLLDFILCMNEDVQSIPDNWEQCSKELGLDIEKLRQCYEGEEGKSLLNDSFRRAAQAGASGSPTIVIGNEVIVGLRTADEMMKKICNALETKPDACNDLPECFRNSDCNEEEGMVGICENPGTEEAKCIYKEPETVNMIVLNDERCEECSDIQQLVDSLKDIFIDVNLTEYDYSSEEGKELYESTGITYLPAILFDDTVSSSEGFSNVQAFLDTAGDYYSLRIGANFDPTKEICDNNIDDNGNGLIDCDDADCENSPQCMEKKEVPEVDLYVMSYCPYGAMAEKGIIPVVELLGDKIDFELKFVDYAMHGKKEIDENLVEYCIQKEEPEKFIEYLRCFLDKGTEEGSIECREEVGIDEDLLNQCLEETEEEYGIYEAYEDKSTWLSGVYPIFPIYKDECDKYGISGSPGLVINNVTIPQFGRSQAAFLSLICSAFEEPPAECDEELSNVTPAPGFGWEGSASSASESASC